jgi:DNA-binding NtrC family response regulator
MDSRINALLLYDRDEPCGSLHLALEQLGVRLLRVRHPEEAREVLGRLNPPHLFFADIVLKDALWSTAIEVASHASQPVNVILVSRVPDTSVYLAALECGAFDFVVPPFEQAGLGYVVKSAHRDVLRRRSSHQVLRDVPNPVSPAIGGIMSRVRAGGVLL